MNTDSVIKAVNLKKNFKGFELFIPELEIPRALPLLSSVRTEPARPRC